MPELPEVESIRRILQDCLSGKKIIATKFFFTGMLGKLTAEAFAEQVCGKKILEMKRLGKYLYFCLSEEQVLEVHLRMTGVFFFFPQGHPAGKYIRAILFIEGGSENQLQDVRKIGTLRLWDRKVLDKLNLARLGPDLLETVHDLHFFRKILQKKPRSCLKAFLLDQKNLAGLGNIYTDEALFLAGLNPSRKVETLNVDEQANLLLAIQNVLREGIEYGGVSVANYRDPYGRSGEFQHRLKVYRREKEPCPRCGEAIVRRVVAGRGTYFCPSCQVM